MQVAYRCSGLPAHCHQRGFISGDAGDHFQRCIARPAILWQARHLYGVADEGGYWPEFSSNEAILQFMTDATSQAGYVPGKDAAISSTSQRVTCSIRVQNAIPSAWKAIASLRNNLPNCRSADCDRYPIVSLEGDGRHRLSTGGGWSAIASVLRDRVQLIGDDLFTITWAAFGPASSTRLRILYSSNSTRLAP